MRLKTALTLVSTAVILCGTALEASANGGGTAGLGSCVVKNPGNGATAIRGVAAVVVPDAYTALPPSPFTLNPSATVDITLRVQKGSVLQAFRLRISGVNIKDVLDNTVLACLFLDPVGNPDPAVRDFVDAIAQFLGVGPVTKFVITDKSITNTEPVPGHDQQVCTDVALDQTTGLPMCWPNDVLGGTTAVSSVADIVFYTE